MNFQLGEFLLSLVKLTTFDYLRAVWADDLAPGTIEFILDVIGILIVSTFALLIVLVLIWLERKVIARIQDRIGPNRVGGRWGLLQTVADVLKLLTKESLTPAGADWWAYNLAPFLTVMTALLMWAVMPFAPNVIGVDLNIGLFYILAVSSASVVVLLLAGWGSNNKYALLGAFRSVAQLVSYEVPMVLALIVPILLAQSMYMQGIINAQTVPFFFVVPLSAIIFFISALAETGRTPFDLLEAESEIVAGFHVEYSGMKFGMFFLAEFVSTLFMSGLFVTVYLGGWRLFGLERQETFGRLFGLIIFFVKTFLVYFVFIWVRGTLPRVRVDQMLNLNWKFLVPLSLVLVLVVAVVEKLIPAGTNLYYRAGIHLISNVVIGIAALEILRRRGQRARSEIESRVTATTATTEELMPETAH
jgi:NADH-quinone oxidoreductase subunit H